MSVLHGLSYLISVGLFGTLAGLSLVALSILFAIRILSPTPKDAASEAINRYFGIGYFVSSLAFFIFGLFLTLLLDSLGKKYHDNLAFEICDVILKVLPLVVGIVLLLGGVDALVLATLKRRFRFFPRSCRHITRILEIILPTENGTGSEQQKVSPQESKKKEENQTIKSKTGDTGEPLDNESGFVIRQLADQLKTVFIVGLLSLWLATLKLDKKMPASREAWWHFVILSVFALLLWLFWGRKRFAALDFSGDSCVRWPDSYGLRIG